MTTTEIETAGAAETAQVAETETAETTVKPNNVEARRKQLGVSRAALAQLTGITEAKIWRVERGRDQGTELTTITAALDEVEKNGLPEHLQTRRAGGGNADAKTVRPTKAGAGAAAQDGGRATGRGDHGEDAQGD